MGHILRKIGSINVRASSARCPCGSGSWLKKEEGFSFIFFFYFACLRCWLLSVFLLLFISLSQIVFEVFSYLLVWNIIRKGCSFTIPTPRNKLHNILIHFLLIDSTIQASSHSDGCCSFMYLNECEILIAIACYYPHMVL